MAGDETVRPGPEPSIPEPADPTRRRCKLPFEFAKPTTDDPDAPAHLKELMGGSSYRIADEDTEFLHRQDMRGTRLHLDYLKPELLLREHGVYATIVVFGGTRIVEPCAARRRVEAAEAAVAEDPHDAGRARDLETARRILAKSRHYDVAREFGRIVGGAGDGAGDNRVVLATGGGPGIMEASNRGAFDVGAETIGFNIDLPREQFPNPYITPDLCFRFRYFATRKLHLLLRAKALVVFPGGYGTLDELWETLALVQTRKIPPVPIVLVGEDFWRRFCDVDYLVSEGVVDPEDRELFWFAEAPQEIWDGIVGWHERNGTPLFPPTRSDLDRP